MIVASLVLALATVGGDPFRALSFEAALAAAKSEKKLLVLHFRSDASEPNQKLEKLTLAESRVKSFLSEKVVAVHVDLEREGKRARDFRVESAPTLVFVDAEGMEVDRIAGFLDAKSFLAQARGTLEGKDALFRLRARVVEEGTPRLHLELGRALLARGQHAEALQELLWCFDHGVEKDPDFAATRATEVMPEIHRLGQAFPDALEQLARRSEAAEARVMSGKAGPSDVEDVILLDEKLGRIDRMMALYDALHGKPESADARRRLGPHVFVVLLADARYADALECIGDPAADLEGQIAACVEAEKKPAERSDKPQNSPRREVVQTGARYYEVLLALGDEARSAALLERILTFDPTVATYERLMDHALRAGKPYTALAIGQRGVAATSTLSAEDQKRLKRTISGLPATH